MRPEIGNFSEKLIASWAELCYLLVCICSFLALDLRGICASLVLSTSFVVYGVEVVKVDYVHI